MKRNYYHKRYLLNKKRERYYGLRIGDLVKIRRYANAFRYLYGIVVDLGHTDNNRVTVYFFETDCTRELTAEECILVEERNSFKLTFNWK